MRVVVLALLGIMLVAMSGCKGANKEALKVGDPAPAFSLPSAAGDRVSLTDFQGKSNVLLYFHMAYG